MTRAQANEIMIGRPEGELSAGRFIIRVGRKYYYVLNVWDGSRIEKIAFGE